MPRITPLPRSKFPVGARILDRFTRRMFGQSLAPAAMHAHSPGLVWSQAWMDKFTVGRRSVPSRLIELVVLRAALELDCPFCVDLGSYSAATIHGVTPDELRELSRHTESALFDDGEKAALDLAVAMSATPVAVDDDLFERLHEHFDERQIVELTAAAAWENYRSRSNIAMGMTSQGFSAPGACATLRG